MNTNGIDHNLNRDRIRKLLIIGAIGSVLTALPDQKRFEQFEASLSLSSGDEAHR